MCGQWHNIICYGSSVEYVCLHQTIAQHMYNGRLVATKYQRYATPDPNCIIN